MGHKAIATDIPSLIPTLAKNLRFNNIDDRFAQSLLWGSNHGNVRSILADLGGLDGIIMADCIYSEASAKQLVETLVVLLEEWLSRESESLDGMKWPDVICLSELRNQQAQDEFCVHAATWFRVELVEPSVWHATLPASLQYDHYRLYRLCALPEKFSSKQRI
jgi:hypothetical protein